ncbi:MAG: GH3 auxin-responsive promoter family protein [Pseudomonadota bacterium]
MITKVLPYLWYPILLSSAVLAFSALLSTGVSPALAAYGPIIAVALCIIVLERYFPERLAWRPTLSDIKADAAFMATVQVLLPRALSALTLLAISSSWMQIKSPSTWWPHSWPLAAQIITMVFAVDFLRYWLHRASHHYNFLWRLHKIHHSPDILYSLNVGRFHPIEKVLHFSLDALPFFLLGISPAVIAGYFLLYSVNGFFQHSNICLRYGFLNYIVGSAETHRWHHARDPKIASCNFGNTTILWDVLFGTWSLPKHQTVEIGITDRAYPKGFFEQLAIPFHGSMRACQYQLEHRLIKLIFYWIRFWKGRKIRAMAKDPMRIQKLLLVRIMHDNRNTQFGREHHFSQVNDYESFAQYIAVNDYETLRSFVHTEIEQGTNTLTAEAPECYLRTSGTTGQPKDIPLTPSHLKALQRLHQTALAFQHKVCPEAFSGSILAITSPAYEGTLLNGKPFGSASGIVSRHTPLLLRHKFIIPPCVLTIANSQVKYLLILRLALMHKNMSYVSTANSSTLLTLIKLYHEHHEALIEDIRYGTFFLSDHLPIEILAAISNRLYAKPARANELNRLKTHTLKPRIADLWPALRCVVTWTCASAGIAANALRCELLPQTHLLELGYLSSEFRGTITLGKHAGSGLPTLDTHFFEFVERNQWEAGTPEFLTLENIRKGFDYYVVITTPSGLYRYFINDVVRVTGYLYKTPLLKFQQKGKGVTNITGEKVYEAQVLAAVTAVLAEYSLTARFVMTLADETAQHYCLYIEAEESNIKPTAMQLAKAVDIRLAGLNIEYQSKRESTRLGPLQAYWLISGTGDAYKQQCVQQGQREGQFKMVALAYSQNVTFNFAAYVEPN